MRRFALVVAVVALVALVACGGTKRPPAVATDAGSGSGAAAGSSSAAPDRAQPLDAGPDVQPLDDEGRAERTSPTDPEPERAKTGRSATSSSLTTARRSRTRRSPRCRRTPRGSPGTRRPASRSRATATSGAPSNTTSLWATSARGPSRSTSRAGYPRGAAGDGVVRQGAALDTGSGEAAWSRNRRAHFVVGR